MTTGSGPTGGNSTPANARSRKLAERATLAAALPATPRAVLPERAQERLELVKPEPPLRGAPGQRLLGEAGYRTVGRCGAMRRHAERDAQSVFCTQPGWSVHNETNWASHALAEPVQPPVQVQPLCEAQESAPKLVLQENAEPLQLLLTLLQ